jgi:hypothetical protein
LSTSSDYLPSELAFPYLIRSGRIVLRDPLLPRMAC